MIGGYSGSLLSPGNEVSVEIMLDTNLLFGQRCIRGRGIVARAERDDAGMLEIAIDFNSVMFGPVSHSHLHSASNQIT